MSLPRLSVTIVLMAFSFTGSSSSPQLFSFACRLYACRLYSSQKFPLGDLQSIRQFENQLAHWFGIAFEAGRDRSIQSLFQFRFHFFLPPL